MKSVTEADLAGLTQGQKAATTLILQSSDRFVAIQGFAGTGKTTQFKAVMRVISALPDTQRPQVTGLATTTHRAGQ
jgi:predicted ribonuclease YlaK